MFQHITHPISGILASIFAFMSTMPENINWFIQMVSAFLGLIIAVLSAITAIEKFINRKKK
tara:strand:- start:8381 stop:8563 length:183 start_codon:yes stop_codon:yes gene_type:complete